MNPDPEERAARQWRVVAGFALIGWGVAALRGAIGWVDLSGASDPIRMYDQAARLFPFTDNWYGPIYFLALRVVRDLSGLDWFWASKIVGLGSALVVMILAALLLERVLGSAGRWFALALVVLTPDFVTQSYTPMNVMFGTVWILAALLVVTVRQDRCSQSPWRWLVAGLLLGIGYLTRFQTAAVAIGLAAGLLLVPGLQRRRRVLLVAVHLVGMILPILLWNGVLLWKQGFRPANLNVVNLAYAAGDYQSFSDVSAVVGRYGTMLELLKDPGAIIRIVGFGLKESVRFPFTTGFELLHLGAGFLVPGLVLSVTDRKQWQPWLVGSLVCVALTILGGRGWPWYFLPALPALMVLVSRSVAALPAGLPATGARIGLVAASFLLFPFLAQERFAKAYWPEITPIKRFLEARVPPGSHLASSTRIVGYALPVRSTELADLITRGAPDKWPAELAAAAVSHVIVFERHTLADFGEMRRWLTDSVPSIPGLVRDTLVTTPMRAAVFRVVRSTVPR